jgi:hypothetical protein
MCYPNLIVSKFVAISMLIKRRKKESAFSLDFVLFAKK